MRMFSLHCSTYGDGEAIPLKCAHQSAGGKNISPGFSWTDPPINTKSFAFSIIDPHPIARNWVHWFIINIPFRDRELEEGVSMKDPLPMGSKELMNTYGEMGYGGPAPPKGSGVHPYVATLYALDVDMLNIGKNTTLREFQRAIDGKVIEEASMTGKYER